MCNMGPVGKSTQECLTVRGTQECLTVTREEYTGMSHSKLGQKISTLLAVGTRGQYIQI